MAYKKKTSGNFWARDVRKMCYPYTIPQCDNVLTILDAYTYMELGVFSYDESENIIIII